MICMCCLMMRDIHTHIDAVLVVVVLMKNIYIYCVSFPIPGISGKIKG
jgi:hypothetical protein